MDFDVNYNTTTTPTLARHREPTVIVIIASKSSSWNRIIVDYSRVSLVLLVTDELTFGERT